MRERAFATLRSSLSLYWYVLSPYVWVDDRWHRLGCMRRGYCDGVVADVGSGCRLSGGLGAGRRSVCHGAAARERAVLVTLVRL